MKFDIIAFKASEILRCLATYSFGGCDLLGYLPRFYKKTASLLAPKLAVIFRALLRRFFFPVCWHTANVTSIPKGSSASTHPSDYRPISITPVLSKIF